jgi:hypothetical protein
MLDGNHSTACRALPRKYSCSLGAQITFTAVPDLNWYLFLQAIPKRRLPRCLVDAGLFAQDDEPVPRHCDAYTGKQQKNVVQIQ